MIPQSSVHASKERQHPPFSYRKTHIRIRQDLNKTILIQRRDATVKLDMIIPQSFKRLTVDGNLTFRQITQRIHHQPTHLTIRTLETLTRPCTTFPQSWAPITQKHTPRRNRTRLTQRRFRRTHNRTQFHNRLIPHHRRTVEPPAFRRIILRQHLLRQRTLSRTRRTTKRLHTKKNPRKHPANIRIDHRDALAERETHHRAGRVIADTRQSQQLIVCLR